MTLLDCDEEGSVAILIHKVDAATPIEEGLNVADVVPPGLAVNGPELRVGHLRQKKKIR